jgi:hypothetical protein
LNIPDMRILIGVFAAACVLCCGGPQSFTVRAPGISAVIGVNGIEALTIGAVKRSVRGATAIDGLTDTRAFQLSRDGNIVVLKRTTGDAEHRATVVERFSPGRASIRWEVEIRGEGSPWTAPIHTVLRYPVTPLTKVWAAWSDPVPPDTATEKKLETWPDPLRAAAPTYRRLWYGAPYFKHEKPRVGYCPLYGDLLSIPLFSFLEPERDSGVSVVLSPDGEWFDLTLDTRKDGTVDFARRYHRLGGDAAVRFAVDLAPHEADWRGGLRWMAARYPAWFNPVLPLAHELSGTGAYSASEVDFDAEKLRRMAFRTNWKASFDFPYMGMFLPPAGDDSWPRFAYKGAPQTYTSIKQIAAYSSRMRAAGFHVLNYFNVTEFGAYVKYPPRPRTARSDDELWKNGDDFLYGRLSDAILPVPGDIEPNQLRFYGKTKPGGPYYTWEGGIVMDCGEPAYKKFLLEQARKHIEQLPDSSGICIDRLDWLRMYNEKGDDGVSWYNTKAARSLYHSWRELTAELAPMFHQGGKVVFVNNHIKRLDLLKDIDGIFDEFTYNPAALNTTALLSIKRPALGWTSDEKQIRPDPDGFFQRFLYLGVFPMAPFPGNDHSLRPSDWVDRQYLDYGPLMNAMRGRVWVLEPHAVEVLKGSAVANLFAVDDGYVASVMLAGAEKVATVSIRTRFERAPSASAIHPGAAAPVRVSAVRNGGAWVFEVPLVRGCAMLVVKSSERQASLRRAE